MGESLGDHPRPKQPTEWAVFLEQYAKGYWPNAAPGSEGQLALPNYSSSAGVSETGDITGQEDMHLDADLPLEEYEKRLYPSIAITDETAEAVRRYVELHEYLPPPRSPLENRRLECIEQYDLNSPEQLANIQRVVDVIGAFFPQAIITYTQFEGKIPMYLASGGNQELIEKFGITTLVPVSPYTAICGHTVLLQNDLMFIPDLRGDFRFRSNPATMAGARSYIGSQVSLPLDPLPGTDTDTIETVGVGALNVLFVGEPHEVMSPSEEMVIKQVARLLESQIRSTWDGANRTQEAKKRVVVANMIETTFVEEQRLRQEESANPTADAIRLLQDRDAAFATLASQAVDRLASTLEALSGITLLSMQVNEDDKDTLSRSHRCSLIAQNSEVAWRVPEVLPAVNASQVPTQAYYSRLSGQSGLESFLPPETGSHLVMPFFASDRPHFAIVATSKRPAIANSDISFVRTVGAILLTRRVQDIAIEADLMKTAFITTMSHEIRTPLHNLLSSVSLIGVAADAQDWDDVRGSMETVRASGLALQTIVNDLLDFGDTTTIEARDMAPVAGTDTLAIVREAVDMAMTQYRDQGSGFSLRLLYTQGSWLANISPRGYLRIFLNGLTNALKFCPQGAITITLAKTDRSLVTTIHDRGSGLDEGQVPRLMRAFTKGKEHSNGAGMGLYIAKRLVGVMGGELRLTSDPTNGTTFRFSLPDVMSSEDTQDGGSTLDDMVEMIKDLTVTDATKSVPAASSAIESKAPQPPPIVVAVDSLRVLVVDDNAVCRRILKQLLKRLPGTITTAEADDGDTALDTFQDFAPHLVLTDISMPRMDGVTSAQHMRRIANERRMEPCKIYALTGLGTADPRLKAAGLRGTAALDGWLVKGQDDLVAIKRIVADLWANQLSKAAGDIAKA